MPSLDKRRFVPVMTRFPTINRGSGKDKLRGWDNPILDIHLCNMAKTFDVMDTRVGKGQLTPLLVLALDVGT